MDNLLIFAVKVIVIIFVVSTIFGFLKETISEMGKKGHEIGSDLGKRTVFFIPVLYNKLIEKLSSIGEEKDE